MIESSNVNRQYSPLSALYNVRIDPARASQHPTRTPLAAGYSAASSRPPSHPAHAPSSSPARVAELSPPHKAAYDFVFYKKGSIERDAHSETAPQTAGNDISARRNATVSSGRQPPPPLCDAVLRRRSGDFGGDWGASSAAASGAPSGLPYPIDRIHSDMSVPPSDYSFFPRYPNHSISESSTNSGYPSYDLRQFSSLYPPPTRGRLSDYGQVTSSALPTPANTISPSLPSHLHFAQSRSIPGSSPGGFASAVGSSPSHGVVIQGLSGHRYPSGCAANSVASTRYPYDRGGVARTAAAAATVAPETDERCLPGRYPDAALGSRALHKKPHSAPFGAHRTYYCAPYGDEADGEENFAPQGLGWEEADVDQPAAAGAMQKGSVAAQMQQHDRIASTGSLSNDALYRRVHQKTIDSADDPDDRPSRFETKRDVNISRRSQVPSLPRVDPVDTRASSPSNEPKVVGNRQLPASEFLSSQRHTEQSPRPVASPGSPSSSSASTPPAAGRMGHFGGMHHSDDEGPLLDFIPVASSSVLAYNTRPAAEDNENSDMSSLSSPSAGTHRGYETSFNRCTLYPPFTSTPYLQRKQQITELPISADSSMLHDQHRGASCDTAVVGLTERTPQEEEEDGYPNRKTKQQREREQPRCFATSGDTTGVAQFRQRYQSCLLLRDTPQRNTTRAMSQEEEEQTGIDEIQGDHPNAAGSVDASKTSNPSRSTRRRESALLATSAPAGGTAPLAAAESGHMQMAFPFKPVQIRRPSQDGLRQKLHPLLLISPRQMPERLAAASAAAPSSRTLSLRDHNGGQDVRETQKSPSPPPRTRPNLQAEEAVQGDSTAVHPTSLDHDEYGPHPGFEPQQHGTVDEGADHGDDDSALSFPPVNRKLPYMGGGEEPPPRLGKKPNARVQCRRPIVAVVRNVHPHGHLTSSASTSVGGPDISIESFRSSSHGPIGSTRLDSAKDTATQGGTPDGACRDTTTTTDDEAPRLPSDRDVETSSGGDRGPSKRTAATGCVQEDGHPQDEKRRHRMVGSWRPPGHLAQKKQQQQQQQTLCGDVAVPEETDDCSSRPPALVRRPTAPFDGCLAIPRSSPAWHTPLQRPLPLLLEETPWLFGDFCVRMPRAPPTEHTLRLLMGSSCSSRFHPYHRGRLPPPYHVALQRTWGIQTQDACSHNGAPPLPGQQPHGPYCESTQSSSSSAVAMTSTFAPGAGRVPTTILPQQKMAPCFMHPCPMDPCRVVTLCPSPGDPYCSLSSSLHEWMTNSLELGGPHCRQAASATTTFWTSHLSRHVLIVGFAYMVSVFLVLCWSYGLPQWIYRQHGRERYPGTGSLTSLLWPGSVLVVGICQCTLIAASAFNLRRRWRHISRDIADQVIPAVVVAAAELLSVPSQVQQRSLSFPSIKLHASSLSAARLAPWRGDPCKEACKEACQQGCKDATGTEGSSSSSSEARQQQHTADAHAPEQMRTLATKVTNAIQALRALINAEETALWGDLSALQHMARRCCTSASCLLIPPMPLDARLALMVTRHLASITVACTSAILVLTVAAAACVWPPAMEAAATPFIERSRLSRTMFIGLACQVTCTSLVVLALFYVRSGYGSDSFWRYYINSAYTYLELLMGSSSFWTAAPKAACQPVLADETLVTGHPASFHGSSGFATDSVTCPWRSSRSSPTESWHPSQQRSLISGPAHPHALLTEAATTGSIECGGLLRWIANVCVRYGDHGSCVPVHACYEGPYPERTVQPKLICLRAVVRKTADLNLSMDVFETTCQSDGLTHHDAWQQSPFRIRHGPFRVERICSIARRVQRSSRTGRVSCWIQLGGVIRHRRCGSSALRLGVVLLEFKDRVDVSGFLFLVQSLLCLSHPVDHALFAGTETPVPQ